MNRFPDWLPTWAQVAISWLTSDFAGAITWLFAAAAALLLLVIALVAVRRWRAGDFNAKLALGFAVVQIGVTFVIVTGVCEFFDLRVGMPPAEAWTLAVFIEAVTWAAVGLIYAHGRGKDKDGAPNTGLGPAGGLFWAAVCGGGALAVLGSAAVPVGVGRLVVVSLGAYMWYLRLLFVTRPPAKPSRLRWSPKRLLTALGVIEPADEDLPDEAREWKVRRLSRAIRWANSRRPWSWLGGRALVKCAETTSEDVLAEARRRWAAAYLMREQSKPGSPVMVAVIKDVQALQTPEPPGGTPGYEPGAEVGAEASTVPGVCPGTETGTHPGTGLGAQAGAHPGDEAGTEAAPKRAPTRVREKTPEQRRAERLRTAHPDWTWKQLADRVGREESTVRRWFREFKTEAPTPAAANGHGPTPTGDPS